MSATAPVWSLVSFGSGLIIIIAAFLRAGVLDFLLLFPLLLSWRGVGRKTVVIKVDGRETGFVKMVAFFHHHIARELDQKTLGSFSAVKGDKLTTKTMLITLHVFIIELYRIQEGIQGCVGERSQ